MHSYHHRIYVPYAFGAFYNTLAEAFLLDTVGTTLSLALAGLTTRQATVFATLSVLKGVDDHCGYKLPWDPLQWLGEQNAEFHDVHHQSWGMGVSFLISYSLPRNMPKPTKLMSPYLVRQTTLSYISLSGTTPVLPFAARAAKKSSNCTRRKLQTSRSE